MGGSVLQRELGKKRPFETPEQEAMLNLVRTTDRLALEFERLFKRHAVSSSQYNVLRILRGHGAPVSCQTVSDEMVTVDPDVTRLVDRLEKAGWARRSRPERDRRVVLVEITPKGLELLRRLDEPVVELHRKQLGHLSRAELAELNRLLVKARRSDN